MFLIKMPLIPGDDYQIHQHVKSVFPGNQKVLFQRTDDCIFVANEEKPVDGFDYVKEIDPSSFTAGSTYAFTIRLNPAKRNNKTRRREPVMPEQTKMWICQQLEKSGVEAQFQYIRESIRRSRKQNTQISLNSVLCFGKLTIKDPDIFRKSFIQGIGHAKGLGFGMFNLE